MINKIFEWIDADPLRAGVVALAALVVSFFIGMTVAML